MSWEIILRGDLAAILTFAAGKKKPDLSFGGRAAWRFNIAGIGVAGTRNHRYRHSLMVAI
jgi:hypothetical protein